MSKSSSHLDNSPQRPANQNNQMSEDPGDGRRLTDDPEQRDATAFERAPEGDSQGEDRVDQLGWQGSVATADKEV